jgi:dTDP-4-dehydrorhamnose reductase
MGCIRGITENSPKEQTMKILLTGAAGQLGQALRQQLPAGVELIATCRSGGNGLLALDLAEAETCREAIRDHRPDWVLNAGGYTAVDKAESECPTTIWLRGALHQSFVTF